MTIHARGTCSTFRGRFACFTQLAGCVAHFAEKFCDISRTFRKDGTAALSHDSGHHVNEGVGMAWGYETPCDGHEDLGASRGALTCSSVLKHMVFWRLGDFGVHVLLYSRRALERL